jgi:mono/diheme cytochrome c family protein
MTKLSALVVLLATAACGSSSSGNNNNANGPSEKDQATVDQGAQSVKTRQCISCHTPNMAGATQMIPYPQDPRVELYPPNLTPDMATGVGKWTDDQLANAIRTGVDYDGLELCPEMKHFSTMNDYEVYSIVKYLRSIPAVNQKILRSVCPPLKTKEEQQAAAQ